MYIPLHYQHNTDYQTCNYYPLHLMIPSCHFLFYQKNFSLDQSLIGTDIPIYIHHWNLQIIYIHGWTKLYIVKYNYFMTTYSVAIYMFINLLYNLWLCIAYSPLSYISVCCLIQYNQSINQSTMVLSMGTALSIAVLCVHLSGNDLT